MLTLQVNFWRFERRKVVSSLFSYLQSSFKVRNFFISADMDATSFFTSLFLLLHHKLYKLILDLVRVYIVNDEALSGADSSERCGIMLVKLVNM